MVGVLVKTDFNLDDKKASKNDQHTSLLVSLALSSVTPEAMEVASQNSPRKYSVEV